MSVRGATVGASETDVKVSHMYDNSWESGMPPEYWRDLEYHERQRRDEGRLTTFVFLDGRLVDCRRESPYGTEWAHLAESHDAEARRLERALNPAPVPRPVHEDTLEWLDVIAGGRSALLALTAETLTEAALPSTEEAPAADAQRLELLWRRLAPMADLFGEESLRAARALVAQLWEEDRTVLTVPATDRVLAGVVWVVARANDLFTRASVTHGVVREALDISAPLTTYGQSLHRVIGGLPALVGSPLHQPDLLAVGRSDLLTSATRQRLIRLRDQALEAASVAAHVPAVAS